MRTPKVTILIPNYKTAELTKLCLRSLRKFTDEKLAHVVVIDNESNDDSLFYLKSLSWIELIERKKSLNESPVTSHALALDLALERVSTPYILSIHTDTIVKSRNWLHFLINEIEKRPSIAGVGSWKLETKSKWRLVLKEIERFTQLNLTKYFGNKHYIEGVGENFYYLRSHCAMYRVALLKKYNLHFADDNMVAGKYIHKRLLEEGFEMIFLPSSLLSQYLDHINHATTILNPHLSRHQKKLTKGIKRVEKSLQKLDSYQILSDPRFDS